MFRNNYNVANNSKIKITARSISQYSYNRNTNRQLNEIEEIGVYYS